MNVLTVNYNTQVLTDAMIKSLCLHTRGCKVYVFDNSDREPYVNSFENVEVIDNTERRIIDLEEWLSSFPDKYPNESNNYGSAKHCKSVDICFELIGEPFLLVDSDILIKRDVTPMYKDTFAAVGGEEVQPFIIKVPRLAPFFCYINVPECLKHGVRFFNGDYMWKLNRKVPNRFYDTGAWFYEELQRKGLPIKLTNIYNYMLHLRNGSWKDKNAEEWLSENKNLYN